MHYTPCNFSLSLKFYLISYPRLPLLSLPNADGPISSYVSNTQYSCCVLSTHIDLKTGMELLPNLHDKMNMNADRKASRSLGGEVVNALLLLLQLSSPNPEGSRCGWLELSLIACCAALASASGRTDNTDNTRLSWKQPQFTVSSASLLRTQLK